MLLIAPLVVLLKVNEAGASLLIKLTLPPTQTGELLLTVGVAKVTQRVVTSIEKLPCVADPVPKPYILIK